MGDTLDYIESECEEWADEMLVLLSKGYSEDEALEIADYPPLEDCWDFLY